MARIAGSVYSDIDPRRFYLEQSGKPSKMMEESLLWRMHGWRFDPNVEEMTNFEEVYTTSHRMVRIFKVRDAHRLCTVCHVAPSPRPCGPPPLFAIFRGAVRPAGERRVQEVEGLAEGEWPGVPAGTAEYPRRVEGVRADPWVRIGHLPRQMSRATAAPSVYWLAPLLRPPLLPACNSAAPLPQPTPQRGSPAYTVYRYFIYRYCRTRR